MDVVAAGVTDPGKKRSNNEDAFLVADDLALYIVADGVGGANAGEIASRLFVETCEQEFRQDNGWNDDLGILIQRCFQNSNKTVIDYAREHAETRGMGCTAEVLAIRDGKYFIGHVGDSRCYLIRDDTITQLTTDHSYVQEQIDLGLLTAEEVDGHWLRNAIYRAIGHDDDLEADLLSGRLQAGDCLLMCSDGLSDMVSSDEMRAILRHETSLTSKVQQLIDTANEHGGKDNITAIVCQVSGPPKTGFSLSSLSSRLFGDH